MVNKKNGEVLTLTLNGFVIKDDKAIGLSDLSLKKNNELINEASFRNLPLREAIKKVEFINLDSNSLNYGDFKDKQTISMYNNEKEQIVQYLITDIKENDKSTINGIDIASDEEFITMKLAAEFYENLDETLVIVAKKDKSSVRAYVYDKGAKSYKSIGNGYFKMKFTTVDIYQ